MDTILWNENQLKEAAKQLRNGEVVAFPTETVYGLGADATNEEAVNKIYQAKGRPSDNPLIVHISNIKQLEDYVTFVPEVAKHMINHFWPGPCTIILEKKGNLAPSVTGNLQSVGIRMPDHPLALALIEEVGKPLAAPSANSSGKPSPTTAQHVWKDLNGKIAGIIDGGATGVGLESTVIDLTNPEKPTILRPGGLSKESLESVLGSVYVDTHLVDETAAPRSPGMKYRHYSPDKPVWILPATTEESRQLVKDLIEKGEVIGLLASEELISSLKAPELACYSLGKKDLASQAASLLYSGLRELDESPVSVILVEAYDKVGIGTAYMNRLEKAAEKAL